MFELDEPFVGKEETSYLKEAIESGWISSLGPLSKDLRKNLQIILV